jgi:signal transduction histidine kinase/CheY-like chemotaxis protein
MAGLSSLVATRLAWPWLAQTPYVLVFAAVAAATQWGSPGAGLLTILVTTTGAALMFPTAGADAWHPTSVAVFIVSSFIGNRVIASRNRTALALRNREAQLRATLDEVRASAGKLRQAQKVQALGHLVAGVAHNFDNVLMVVMGYVHLLLEGDADAELQRKALEEIRKATERGTGLTRQLLAFGRRRDPKMERVHVDRIVDGLSEMLRRVVREDITLTFDLSPETAVTSDPHDLEQVVLNLVMNARDALPAGGSIHVAAARESIAAGDPRLDESAPGEYVHLSVRDDGIGMTATVQAHLFEPFFTTKSPGKGTGLGLAFVKEIASQAGGFVSVVSAPTAGTRVSVYLPAAASQARTAAAPSPAPLPVPSTAATILLVEDDDSVREMIAWILRRTGHRVLPAASPAEAMALFGMYRQEIDVLVTDVVMPQMSGTVLAGQLLVERPTLAVLYVTAYSDAMPARGGTGPMAVLAKPFAPAMLLAGITDLRVRGGMSNSPSPRC